MLMGQIKSQGQTHVGKQILRDSDTLLDANVIIYKILSIDIWAVGSNIFFWIAYFTYNEIILAL